MSKALAYDRLNRQVVLLDTVNNRIDPLGGTVATADNTSGFPGRSANLVCAFRGETFVLYRAAVGTIKLAQLVAGIWTDVAGFTPVVTGSGDLTPTALWVDRDKIVAVWWRSNSAAVDGAFHRISPDGVVWAASVALPLAPVQPTLSQGGNAVAWRNTVFFATASGLAWVAPNIPSAAAAYDGGSDGGLANALTPYGHFAYWNGALYFARAGTVPVLYQLTAAWDPTTPTAAPAWTKVVAAGIPGVGLVSPGADVGTMLLFVNKQDALCLLYSGSIGTKLARATAAAFPIFTDVTPTFLPSPLPTTPDLGVSLYEDDRRRADEKHNLLIRNVVAGSTLLATWDGVGQVIVRTTFAGVQLVAPDERSGARRTYTALQPACHVTGTSFPFPGRTIINYVVRDTLSRKVDVFGEWSLDGDAWSPMSQGDGDDGASLLTTSPVGVAHVFFHDAFRDLDGNPANLFMRVVARISQV